MKTVITGASGFIGRHLSSMLQNSGDEIVALSRHDFAVGKFDELVKKLEGADRIFNLAGANLNKRWTPEYKEEIFSSRVYITAKLVSAINSQKTPPSLFVSTSAVGYYPSDGTYIENTETSAPTFLGHLCRKWEKEAHQVNPATRLVITRLAPVLSNEGGMFPVLKTLFRYGLGGRIGSGHQPFPWIMLSDLMSIYPYIIDHPEISGPVNCSAPDNVDNLLWTKSLSRALHRPAFWVIPSGILRMLLGERAVLLTEGQHAIPYILEKNGFIFEYANLSDALNKLCQKESPETTHKNT